MVLKFVRSLLKWPLITLGIVYMTYTSHEGLERFVNGVKYYHADAEEGFVDKETAFRLDLEYNRNRRGNLETYVRVYGETLPIYMRRNGILVGDAKYTFGSFNSKERAVLCSGIVAEKVYKKLDEERRSKPDNFFNRLYNLFGD